MENTDPSQPNHPNFADPYLLLQHTHENFLELIKCTKEYITSNPFEDIIEINEEKNYQLHKKRLVSAIPNKIRFLTRNILRDLRDSLDHTMHSAALTLGSNRPEKAAFIFSNNSDNYKKEIKNNQGNPKQLNPLLKEISAHKGGDEILYGLSKLRNADTHNKIVAVGSVPKNLVHVITSAMGQRISEWDFEKSEYLYYISPKGLTGTHHVDIELDLLFKGTEYFNMEPVVETISAIASHVDNLVRYIEHETLKIHNRDS